MPQCGYSGTLVNILQSLSVPFETVDVLADERIRQGIKASAVSFFLSPLVSGRKKKEKKENPSSRVRTGRLSPLHDLDFSGKILANILLREFLATAEMLVLFNLPSFNVVA